MPDRSFLTDKNLTHKDKLVLLVADVLGDADPAAVAAALDMGVASVRSSLAKAGQVDEQADEQAKETLQAAIMDVCQMDARSMRQADWKLVAKVAADLNEVGATPDEVRRRARNLTRHFRLPITPGSLDKYWAQLGGYSPFSPGAVYK